MRHTHILCILFAVAVSLQARAGTRDFIVAATIKPVHSLVAGIMRGAGEPELIMKTGASPHHYSLRPSERRLIANASLIFWVGPDLETFMPRLLQNLDTSSASVSLIKADGLQRLSARTARHNEEKTSRVDPHIWLSTRNAHAMVDSIANTLINMEASHASIYEANRERLHQRISETDDRIRRKLSGKNSTFISYHDAYQYFEEEYRLNNAGFVSSGDEVSPGAQYVHELRDKMQKQQIHCLFYEAPERPPLVNTLMRGLAVKALELDAMGISYTAGEDTWFLIMDKIADAFNACL